MEDLALMLDDTNPKNEEDVLVGDAGQQEGKVAAGGNVVAEGYNVVAE